MQLSNKVNNPIKRDFSQKFGESYLFNSAEAPQGQNKYSTNFILNNQEGKKFLLKVLLLSKIPLPNRAQIHAEIEICKKVISPYVVPLVEHAETDKFVFLVFPFLEGKNLEEYIKEYGIIAEDKVKEIGIGILRGISDINRVSNGSIVHQDLKPENIFVTPSDEIILLDFGAARYKQSPFRGNARHNFAYSSREQIRASRPNSIEELRITISDKADVFGAGLILYRLIEGRHPHEGLEGKLPADATLEARPIPEIISQEISVGMRKIIARMLEYEPLNRLNALDALSALQNGEIHNPTLEKSKFFYCAASAVGRFIKLKNKVPGLFDGLVIEATQIPSDQRQVAEMRTNVKTLIIDPQTYLFQKPDSVGKTALEKFRAFPYFQDYHELLEDPVGLIQKIESKDDQIKNFIKKVFQFQINNGADVLLAPYFYIPEFNDDYWTADQEMAKLSAEVYSTLATTKPLLKAVAISEEILQSEDSRNSIIEYLQSLYDYSGFFVLLDSSHRETIINESWLKSSKEFFTHLLATQKFVIWSRAELFGLALAVSGLNIATGEFQKQKKFNITEPLQTHGKRGKYFHIAAMFAKVKWPEGFRALSRYSERSQLICSHDCCDQINFDNLTAREEEDLALHALTALKAQFDSYVGRDGNRKLANDVKKAKEHFENIRTNTSTIVREALKNDIKPGSSSFLSSWTNALGIR